MQNSNEAAAMHRPTPGPWVVREYDDANTGIRKALGVFAPNSNHLRIVEGAWGRTLAESDANLALIAAAPAMLAALQAARACLAQPVQYTGTDAQGATNILRADCKAAVSHIDAALAAAGVQS